MAAIELCSRIWVELERLRTPTETETEDVDALPVRQSTHVEIVRLELTLVLERCVGRWSAQLDQGQSRWIEALMRELLELLDASLDEMPNCQAIACAQNCLLMAVLEQCMHHLEEFPFPAPRVAHGRSPRGDHHGPTVIEPTYRVTTKMAIDMTATPMSNTL